MSRALLTNSYSLSCLSQVIQDLTEKNAAFCFYNSNSSNEMMSSTDKNVIATFSPTIAITPSEPGLSPSVNDELTDELSDKKYIEAEQENIIKIVRIFKIKFSNNNWYYYCIGDVK